MSGSVIGRFRSLDAMFNCCFVWLYVYRHVIGYNYVWCMMGGQHILMSKIKVFIEMHNCVLCIFNIMNKTQTVI